MERKESSSGIIHCQQPLDPKLVENTGPRDPSGPILKLLLSRLGFGKLGELAQP